LTPNEIAIAGNFLATIIFSLLAYRNSRTEKQNVELFNATGEIKQAMWILALLFTMTAVGDFVAIVTNHHSSKDDSWVLAVIGMLAMLAVFIGSLFGIRFEPETFCFGLQHRKRVKYSEIIELKRDSKGKDVYFSLVLKSGKTTVFGTDLSCENLILAELQRRSGCKITRLRFGKPEIENK